MSLTSEEIESLRIAIAEECGWTRYCVNYFKEQVWHKAYKTEKFIATDFTLPPYTTSLDAIQAAAMERFETPDEQARFEHYLIVLKHERGRLTLYNWQLTALDWCIAFARTAKIWRFKE